MNELKTTFIFVGVAAVMALASLGSHFLNQPSNSADFEMVGKPFFEDFTSAAVAESLEVVAVDPESARLKRFKVEKRDGLWRIPSHSDYPAEAAARLATTASSVMGIGRDSLAGRKKKEHERLGVIDPLADDIEDPEGVGKRITLKDSAGDVVVDFIIGKEAGDVVLSNTDQAFANNRDQKYYYIRHPDEEPTYKVKLDIDLSTRFSDWIDPDLLRVDRNDVTKISIDNYSLEEDRTNPLAQNKALFKSQGDKLDISRESSTESWELAGLNPEVEELTTTRVNEMLDVFDQMTIAGVRPKTKYKDHLLLTADLKLNQQPEFLNDPEFALEIRKLQNELDQKGFNLAGSAEKMELVAQNGDLEIGTGKGVVYTLHVGKAFDGDEEAIEIGSTSDSEPDSSTDASNEGDDPTKNDAVAKTDDPLVAEDSKEPLEEAKNRYLMVRVSFEESLIRPQPEEPVAPVAPVEPEGYQPPEKEPAETDGAETDEAKSENQGDDAVEKPPADDKPERNPEFVKYDEALKAYLNQKIEYELAQTRFKSETEAFQKKVVEGKELVKELNERFGDWYYVISGDNLNTLQTKRVDLVTKKEKPAADPVEPQRPDISFPELPNANPDLNKGGEQGSKDEQPVEASKADAKNDPGVESNEDANEKPNEGLNEKPKDEPKSDSKEKSKAGAKDDSKNDPGLESKEDANEKPNEGLNEKPKAEPKGDANEKPKAEPKGDSKEESKAGAKDDSKKDPNLDTNDGSKEESNSGS